MLQQTPEEELADLRKSNYIKNNTSGYHMVVVARSTCDACKGYEPMLQKYEDKLKAAGVCMTVIHTDEEREVVRAFPTTMLFHDGKPVMKRTGALPPAMLMGSIKEAMHADETDELEGGAVRTRGRGRGRGRANSRRSRSASPSHVDSAVDRIAREIGWNDHSPKRSSRSPKRSSRSPKRSSRSPKRGGRHSPRGGRKGSRRIRGGEVKHARTEHAISRLMGTLTNIGDMKWHPDNALVGDVVSRTIHSEDGEVEDVEMFAMLHNVATKENMCMKGSLLNQEDAPMRVFRPSNMMDLINLFSKHTGGMKPSKSIHRMFTERLRYKEL